VSRPVVPRDVSAGRVRARPGLPGLAPGIVAWCGLARRWDAQALSSSCSLALIAGQGHDLRRSSSRPPMRGSGCSGNGRIFAGCGRSSPVAEGAYREADADLAALTTVEGIDVPSFVCRNAPLGTVVAFLSGSRAGPGRAQALVLSANATSLRGEVERLARYFAASGHCLPAWAAGPGGSDVQRATDLFRTSRRAWEGRLSDGAALLARHYLGPCRPGGEARGP